MIRSTQPVTLSGVTDMSLPRRRYRPFLLAALALALFAAGLGVGYLIPRPATQPHAATVDQSGTTAPATQPAASALPAASSPTSAVHSFGETASRSFDGYGYTATAYAYKQPTGTSAPRPDQAGYVWASADVKVCAGSQTITVSNSPWSLVYADDTAIKASMTGYRQFQQPEYPFGDQQVDAGRCLRGWITFAVPGGQRPTMVEYHPQDETAVDWQVK